MYTNQGATMKILFTTISFFILSYSAYASSLQSSVSEVNLPPKEPAEISKVIAEPKDNVWAKDQAPNPFSSIKQDFLSSIKISNEWLRQSSSTSKNTAAYFKINNTSDKDIIINGIETEKGICDRTEIHGYKNDVGDVKKMYKLQSITIPAKSEIEFAPGSFHVMLLGLKNPIMKDANIKISLKMSYADANSKEIIPDLTITFPAK